MISVQGGWNEVVALLCETGLPDCTAPAGARRPIVVFAGGWFVSAQHSSLQPNRPSMYFSIHTRATEIVLRYKSNYYVYGVVLF